MTPKGNWDDQSSCKRNQRRIKRWFFTWKSWGKNVLTLIYEQQFVSGALITQFLTSGDSGFLDLSKGSIRIALTKFKNYSSRCLESWWLFCLSFGFYFSRYEYVVGSGDHLIVSWDIQSDVSANDWIGLFLAGEYTFFLHKTQQFKTALGLRRQSHSKSVLTRKINLCSRVRNECSGTVYPTIIMVMSLAMSQNDYNPHCCPA